MASVQAAPKDSGAPAVPPLSMSAKAPAASESADQDQAQELVYRLKDGQVCRFKGKAFPSRVKNSKQQIIEIPHPAKYQDLLDTISSLEQSASHFRLQYNVLAASTMRSRLNKERRAEWEADKAEAERRRKEEAAAAAAGKETGDLQYALGKKRLPRLRAERAELVPL